MPFADLHTCSDAQPGLSMAKGWRRLSVDSTSTDNSPLSRHQSQQIKCNPKVLKGNFVDNLPMEQTHLLRTWREGTGLKPCIFTDKSRPRVPYFQNSTRIYLFRKFFGNHFQLAQFSSLIPGAGLGDECRQPFSILRYNYLFKLPRSAKSIWCCLASRILEFINRFSHGPGLSLETVPIALRQKRQQSSLISRKECIRDLLLRARLKLVLQFQHRLGYRLSAQLRRNYPLVGITSARLLFSFSFILRGKKWEILAKEFWPGLTVFIERFHRRSLSYVESRTKRDRLPTGSSEPSLRDGRRQPSTYRLKGSQRKL